MLTKYLIHIETDWLLSDFIVFVVKDFEKICVQFKIKIYMNVTIHYLVKAGIIINFVIF